MSNKQHIRGIEHIVFWLFIFLFLFDYYFITCNWGEAIGYTILETLTYISITYFNLVILIPLLLKKKFTALYILSVLGSVVVYICIIRFSGLEVMFYEYIGWRNIFSMVLNTTLFLMISTLYWYYKQWQIERENAIVLHHQKVEAELNFLRAQISPHFIFNTLNNIYALALQKHENTAPMVAKLSAMLRYILYEASKEKSLLSSEIAIVQDYISMQLLRKPKSKNVKFLVDGNLSDWDIAPMLLINLVENAFKHSNIDHGENSWINITCTTNTVGQLKFTVENNIDTSIQKDSGLGLLNFKRQLEINYPGNHSLSTYIENGIYNVQLLIQLNKH